MNPTERLGKKIRDLRKRMRMTQSELAGSDFTKSFISQVEKGVTRPSLKSLEIIAARLNQPVTYFLDDSVENVDETNYASKIDSLIETGSKLHLNGQLSEALNVYEDALNKCHPNDFRRKGEIRHRTAHVYFALGRYEVARDYLILAKDDLRKSNSSEYLARCLNGLATCYDHLGELDTALEFYREAYREISNDPISNKPFKTGILANMGTALARLGKNHAAIEVLNEAIDHTTSTGDYGQYGRCCDTLGFAYGNLGDYEKAILWTKRAVEFFRSVENIPRELHSLNNLASHLQKSGKIGECRQVLKDALELGSKAGIEAQMARAHAGLADIAFDEGNIREAYDEMIQAFTLASNFEYASDWTSKVVECAEIEPVPAELLALIERLAASWKGDSRRLADIHSNLGKIYSLMGETQKANQHLSKSVDLYKQS